MTDDVERLIFGPQPSLGKAASIRVISLVTTSKFTRRKQMQEYFDFSQDSL